MLILLVLSTFSSYAIEQPADFEVDDQSRLVVFGEIHGRPDLQDLMFEYVDSLNSKDQAFDCLFSEFDISAQAKVNQFLSNELTYEESILPFVGERLNLLPKTLALDAKARGLKIIPIDFKYQSEQGRRFFSHTTSAKIFVEERSLLMAENILNAFNENKCQRGVFLVGQVHTWKHAFEEGNLIQIKSVQNYLDELNISAKTYLLHNNGLSKGVSRLH